MSDAIGESLNILSLLRSTNERRGVSKSIGSTIDDAETAEASASLTTNEERRTEKISTILGDTIGRVLQIGKYASPTLSTVEEKRAVQTSIIFGDTIARLLELGKYAKRPEAGRLGDLTPAAVQRGGNLTVSNIQQQSQSPSPGSSLLNALGIGALLYSLLKQNFAGIAQSIYRSIQPMLSRLKSVFQRPLSRLKGVISRTLTGVMERISSITKQISTIISNIVTDLTERIVSLRNSPLIRSLSSSFTSLKTTIGNMLDNVTSSVTKFVKNIASGLTNTASTIARQIPSSGIGASLINRTSTMFSSAREGLRNTASVIGNKILAPIKDRALAQAGRLLSSKGGVKGLLNFFKSALGKVPLAGPFIELLFGSGDIKKFKKEYADGKISLYDLQSKSGNRVLEGLTGLLGGGAGAAVGTLLGGPLGTFLGSIAGDVAGRYLVAPLAKTMLPESSLQKVGATVTGTEMQDFLVKEGKVYSFSSKDEVLGMKTGGAIDNLMKDIATSISKDNKYIKQALFEQIKQQETVIDVLKAILNKPTAQVASNTQTPYSNYINDDFRSAFNMQTMIT